MIPIFFELTNTEKIISKNGNKHKYAAKDISNWMP